MSVFDGKTIGLGTRVVIHNAPPMNHAVMLVICRIGTVGIARGERGLSKNLHIEGFRGYIPLRMMIGCKYNLKNSDINSQLI